MIADEAISADSGTWDAIIVGTGMGGATLGHGLAKQGLRVLFLEKGRATLMQDQSLTGDSDDPDLLLHLGKWPGKVTTVIDGRRSDAPASAGCGLGGSTQLYAAALERFERWDFEATDGMPHPTGGWPVSYDEMGPYYTQAEALYRIRGSRNPLGEMDSPELPRLPPAAAADGQLMRDLARVGLSPYRMHVGMAYLPGCAECLGHACSRACKSDAKLICLDPAVTTMGAEVRTECDVVRLEADGDRVTGIVYRHRGALHRVSGRTVVLAAGAYRSALLLLASANEAHPAGLANSSGMVGQNIMFHSTLWLAVFPSAKASVSGPRKTIATRYFQTLDGARGGLLHSVGLSAGYGNILVFLYEWFDRSRYRWLRPLRPFLRIPAKIAEKLFGSATILSINIEDLPYADNHLASDPANADGVIAHYQIRSELRDRTQAIRRAISSKLAGLRTFWLHSDMRFNLGHPCGTCRFGDDPTTSVLDATCRAHDLDNLYVVDASFMPTSGGANPSLTIAANALRVADILGARLRSETA